MKLDATLYTLKIIVITLCGFASGIKYTKGDIILSVLYIMLAFMWGLSLYLNIRHNK